MAFDNLPPGVSPRDIPGNRPEDEAFRDICHEIEEEHPEWDREKVEEEAERRFEDRWQ